MDKSNASGIESFKLDYKVGSSTASTKAALKQSMFNIRNNQHKARVIERSSSQTKLAFYQNISKKSMAYLDQPGYSSGQKRPISQYLTLRPQTASNYGLQDPEMLSATENQLEEDISLKPKNPNLAAHFNRTLVGGMRKGFNRTQSAFNVRKLESSKSISKQQPQEIARPYSSIKFERRNIQSAAAHKQDVIEELQVEQGDSRSEQQEEAKAGRKSASVSHTVSKIETESQRENKKITSFYENSPLECMDHVIYRLSRCREMAGEADEEYSKRQEEMKKEQLLMLTGKGDAPHPWDHVSLYTENEPEFNNPNYKGDYKRHEILRFEATDEEELRILVEEAYERFDFFKKHTALDFDYDYKFLKVTQARLTCLEIEKIKDQFQSKKEGGPFDWKVIEEVVRPLLFFMKFDLNIREKLISKAELCSYPMGHTIFRQGDFGDKMYIILKGSVNVIIHYTDPITGKPGQKTVAWMRDGSSFGEYSMLGSKSRAAKDSVFTSIAKMVNNINSRLVFLKKSVIYQQEIDLKSQNMVEEWKKKKAEEEAIKYNPSLKVEAPPVYQERTKRAADIVVAEDILLFELSREYFREIIMETIKDEHEKKMRILADLPLFKVPSAFTRCMSCLL